VDQTSIINRLNPELFQLCWTTVQDGWTDDSYHEMMEVRHGVLMLLMRRLELVHRNPTASGGSNCRAGAGCGGFERFSWRVVRFLWSLIRFS
jgi:hypothetical protein